jgi:5'-nucleotidase
MKIFRKCFLFLVLSISLPVFAQDAPVRITILHVNDVYQFLPVDKGERGGLARLMTIRKDMLENNPNTIFTMGGDTISPSAESIEFNGAQMIDAWNMVGIDYAVFGNHEFDFKSAELLKRMAESKFKWLGANVWDTNSKKIFADLPEYEVRTIDGVKIGFIGLLLPDTKKTSRMDKWLEVNKVCDTAKLIVPKMRAAGINTVVALTHLSMSEDKELAGCADIDLILGGHEHTLLQSSANGTPIFKMTADAREVGKFDLFIERNTGKLRSMDWEVIPVNSKVTDDPEFIGILTKYKAKLVELAVRLGYTSVQMDATSLSSRTRETNIGNFLADIYRDAVQADAALINGGGIRADFMYEPGPLTKRDVLSIMPFNNQIVKLKMNGKLLREALEYAVSRSAEDQEPGQFPQVSGFSFTFDASKPAGSRIVDIRGPNCKPFDENTEFTLATSNYLFTGGDGYDVLKKASVIGTLADAPREIPAFEAAIKNSPKRTIAPRVEGRIIRVN